MSLEVIDRRARRGGTAAVSREVCAVLPGLWLPIALAASCALLCLLLAQARIGIDVRGISDRLIAVIGAAVAVAACALRAPATRAQHRARDAIEYVGLFMAISLVGAAASYPVAADTHGFADAGIARIDRALGFDWIAWYRVVAAHPALQIAGGVAYQSIFVSPAILLGCHAATGRRAEARRFLAGFLLSALVTLALFALAPARGPLAYLWHGPIPYMPASALYQADIIPHLRLHEVPSLAAGSLHGLVCMPSFHTVAGVLYIAAAWRIAALRWPLLLLNAAMLLATPVEGTHYLTDMIVGALVAAGSLVAVEAALARLAAPRGEAPPEPRDVGELAGALVRRHGAGAGAHLDRVVGDLLAEERAHDAAFWHMMRYEVDRLEREPRRARG